METQQSIAFKDALERKKQAALAVNELMKDVKYIDYVDKYEKAEKALMGKLLTMDLFDLNLYAATIHGICCELNCLKSVLKDVERKASRAPKATAPGGLPVSLDADSDD